jgi:hypothetical protein
MSTGNSRFLQPITLHRKTKTAFFGKVRKARWRRGKTRVMISRPGRTFQIFEVAK